jgi:Rhodopirellula transposase DDE domain
LYREGRIYTTEEIQVFDHDWKSLAVGVAIPHGLYDLTLNVGYIQIGTSHDTGEFACDSIRYWWQHYGSVHYRSASSLLLLWDGGGSNSSRQYLFKQDLQALVNELGIEIRIAHYPPYTSKYNPIEHRLFPHLTRVCQGVIFDSVDRGEGIDGEGEDSYWSESVYHCLKAGISHGTQSYREFQTNDGNCL